MSDEEVIQYRMQNYTNDKHFVNKFQHNLNILFEKVGKDSMIGKRIEILQPTNLFPSSKKGKLKPVNKPKKLNLPSISHKDEFEFPKYISVDKYNNYKFASTFINYLPKKNQNLNDLFTAAYKKKDHLTLLEHQKAQIAYKKGQWGSKQMPLYLQSRDKKLNTSRDQIFALNDDTKQLILQKQQPDTIYSEQQSQIRDKLYSTEPGFKVQLHTVTSALIKSQYDKTLRNFRPNFEATTPTSEISNIQERNQSIISNFSNVYKQNKDNILLDEITVNNTLIGHILKTKKELSINPAVYNKSQKKKNACLQRILGALQEYLRLYSINKRVKNRFQKQTNLFYYFFYSIKEPFVYLFIIRNAYSQFQELLKPIQDRIFLAFDINPYEEESKVFYDQFLKFKQIIICQSFNEKDLIKFLMKFLNPEDNNEVSISELRSIIRIICSKVDQNDEKPLEDYFMENIFLSEQISENHYITSENLELLLKTNSINPYFVMELLMNNI